MTQVPYSDVPGNPDPAFMQELALALTFKGQTPVPPALQTGMRLATSSPTPTLRSYGTKVLTADQASAGNGNAVVSNVYPYNVLRNGSGYATKCAAQTVADIKWLSSSYTVLATDTALGVWIYRRPDSGLTTTLRPVPCLVSATNTTDALTKGFWWQVAVYPGLHFYVLPLPWTNLGASPSVAGITGGAALPYTINWLRVDSQNTYGSYMRAVTSDDIYIGDITVNPKGSKAKFAFTFDGSSPDAVNIFHNSGNGVVDGTGATQIHSLASLLESFGMIGNYYAISGALGQSSNITPDQLKELAYEYGWTIGNHGRVHPAYNDGGIAQTGSAVLTPAAGSTTAITTWASGAVGSYSPSADANYPGAGRVTNYGTFDAGCASALKEMQDGASDLAALGFQSATRHHALSQGIGNLYVTRACDLSGFKTIRNVAVAPVLPNYMAEAAFYYNGGEHYSRRCNLTSFQMDGSGTLLQFQDYIQRLIAFGANGTCYTHSWGSGSDAYRTIYSQCVAYVYQMQQAGLIDVVGLDAFLT